MPWCHAGAPAGAGDGEYAPLQAPRAVVAVVGSAHVRGMCRQWEDVVRDVRAAGGADVDDLLKM